MCTNLLTPNGKSLEQCAKQTLWKKGKRKKQRTVKAVVAKSDSLKRKMGYGSKTMKRPASKKDKPLKKEASSKKGQAFEKKAGKQHRPSPDMDKFECVQCYLPRKKLYHRGARKAAPKGC